MKWNKDVPDSAIIKQLSIENGKLKSEIAHLESKLENKDNAISAFKDWQKRVAKYQFQYWLSEGVKILDNPPSEKELHRLRSILGISLIYDKKFKELEKRYNSLTRVMNAENKDNLLRSLCDES